MHKKLCAALFALLLSASLVPVPARAAASVTATIPTYTWELEYENIDYRNSLYPPLNYKGVTYFPMTWGYCRLLGLTSVWIDGEGLFIASWGSYGPAAGDEFPTYPAAKNTKSVTATLANYPIYVNGKKIDNSKEEYPLLNFRGVTYFPMTWRFAREEFNWDTDWSQEENRFSVHWQIDSGVSTRTEVYEQSDTAAYLVQYELRNVQIGVTEQGDAVYTTKTAQKFYALDFATGELRESEERASYESWANGETDGLPAGCLPEGVTIRTDVEYTESPYVIPAPYTPFIARGYVTVDGTEYPIGEGGDADEGGCGVTITDAVRAGGYVFCNARRYTGWKYWTNPNYELYRIDIAKGTVERLDTKYENYASMKLLGCAADGMLVVKCQQGSKQYDGEGGVMEASAYNDGYYAMDLATGKLKLLRRFVYTDDDILTPDGHIYGIFDWKGTVEKLY